MKMKNTEFVERLISVVKNYKTLYVMDCYGSPLTEENKERFIRGNEFNRRPERESKIRAAGEDIFGFDCVNLIKGILWGWTGDPEDKNGGAIWGSHQVPDIDSNTMIQECIDISRDFKTIIKGEVVWFDGHIGVYLGDGLVIECSPTFEDCVQITKLENDDGSDDGHENKNKNKNKNSTGGEIDEDDDHYDNINGNNRRQWVKHGKLPYIEYVEE